MSDVHTSVMLQSLYANPVVYLCDAVVDGVVSEMYLGNKLYNKTY